jgi:hypothetical protein
MPVEYPVMIAAIKQWIGGHKTTPSQSMEIDGQPAMKKAGLMDMLAMALTEGITAGVSGGLAFLGGGAEGFDKFYAALPEAVKGPLDAIKDAFPTLSSGSEGSTFSEALQWSKETFINPIGETIDAFKAGFSLGPQDLAGFEQTAQFWDSAKVALLDDTTLTAEELENLTVQYTQFADSARYAAETFSTGAAGLGASFAGAMDSVKSFSDSITFGSEGYSVTDIIKDANNSSSTLFEVVGIKDAPTIDGFAGILVKDELLKTAEAAAAREEALRNEDLTDPEKMAEWAAAHAELDAAVTALKNEAADNQAAIVKHLAESAALGAIGETAANIKEIESFEDPKSTALYKSTLHPSIKATAEKVAPLMTPPPNTTQTSPETAT